MKVVSVLLALQFGNIVAAQLMTGHSMSNGVTLWYETRLEPPSPSISSFGGGTLTENNVIKHYRCDLARKSYFGYDLTTEALPDGQYRLKFSPLTITPQKMEEVFKKVKGWTLLPLPQSPATEVLRDGDTMALDLFVNPSTGQKIVEYIRVQGGQGRLLSASGPSRDFLPEDAWLEISQPRLLVNGKPVDAPFSVPVSGPLVSIPVSGHGRFTFSLIPRWDLGYQKAGEIRGSTLSWRWGADEFSINTNKRIAPGGGAYNAYVLHEITR